MMDLNEKFKEKIDMKSIIKNKKIMIIAIALIIVILFAVNVFAQKNEAKGSASSNAVTVEIVDAKIIDSTAGLTYKANLEPAEEAAVSSNVSGQVTQVLFDDGDKVSQGQALAYMDDKDLQNQLKTAKIDLSKLQLDLDAAKSDFDIAKELYANGACSKTSYENAERAYKTVQANVELKKVGIQDINNSLSDCVIKAPISGEVGEKSISVGQYVNPGTVVALVKNNTSIQAVIKLMQEDLEKVTVGQEVSLKLSKSEEINYKGIVKTIAASADSQTRVFDCLIEFDNTSGTLNSGVFGYVEISDSEKKQVLAVPMSAVLGSEGDYSVFTYEGGTARKISVRIGTVSDDMVEVTWGIQEGDQIITTNLNSLQDGDKVTVSGKVE